MKNLHNQKEVNTLLGGQKKWCWIVIVFGLLLWEGLTIGKIAYASDPIRVAYVNPATKGNPFWDSVTDFMQAVANDLEMQLQVIYANDNSFITPKLVDDLLQSGNKPDYLMYIYQSHAGQNILKIAEEAKVRSFIFNTDVLFEERESVGTPRGIYSHWIGHLIPDDVQAGRDLALHLLKSVKSLNKPMTKTAIHAVNAYQVFGISGRRDSSATIDRNEGLLQALDQHPEMNLQQLVFSNWDMDVAKQQATHMLRRYPKTTIIWTVSDGIGLEVVKAIREKGKRPGVDVVTGGVDWTEDAVKAVQQGDFVATLGGHFMHGGWSLVLIHDYHHGKDFKSSLGTTIRMPMQSIHKGNVDAYIKDLGSRDWDSIDYRGFSKVLNPKLQSYDFSLNALLKAK